MSIWLPSGKPQENEGNIKMHLRLIAVLSVMTVCSVGAAGETLTVDATADICSAGHPSVPATIYPGAFASSVVFQAQPSQVLTFSSVTGMIGCNFSVTNGPDGTCFPGVDTRVTSYGGLSGISVKAANMFLVGVFLNNAEPSGSGPLVLSYDAGTAGGMTTADSSFAPAIDQVFFVGDGLTGTGSGQQQQFYVPTDATRLYLGFADSFDSVPSYYADDMGSLDATFQFSTAAPEAATFFPVGLGLVLAGLLRRTKGAIS